MSNQCCNQDNKKNKNITLLRDRALQLSRDVIRATTAAGSGHPTSCMSSSEIMATLFFQELSFNLADHNDPNNDRFIMSKGHAVPVLYAAYKQLGIISDEELCSLRQVNSRLEGHPTPRFIYNETATGSLGQGLAVGVGMALNARLDQRAYRTVVLLGDGEIAEGSVWEAASLAAHYHLDNLLAIVDVNRLGQSGTSLLAHEITQYEQRFAAFGWHAITINGHDCAELLAAYAEARTVKDRPTVIIAKTMKGHGLELCEDKIGFHGKPFTPQEAAQACQTLQMQQSDSWLDSCNVFNNVSLAQAHKFSEKSISGTVNRNVIFDDHKKILEQQNKCSVRKAVGYALAAHGRAIKELVALDADVKNSTHFDIFEKEHPDRFIQCFIAEQLLVGVAVGLSARGKIPFAATFGAFFTRAHDQLRMAGIGKNALRLSGTHCGVSIGEDGPSQMALEDIGMIASIPHSIVLYPSDAISAYKLVGSMIGYEEGISYIRATRADTPYLYDFDEEFVIGGSKILRQSNKDQVLLVAAGITVHEALKAADELQKQGIAVAVIDLYSVKPFDEKTVIALARASSHKIISIEDHYRYGGIGQMLAEKLVGTGIELSIMSVEEVSRSGKPHELLAFAGIDAASIVQKVKKIVS